jgi:murein DD-endopeptidase MepM/ murein hydrolase activator NlpD
MPRLFDTDKRQNGLVRRISRETRSAPIADREIIIRSRGRVSYIRVPRFFQIAGLLVAAVAAVWLVHTSYAYVAHYEIISARDAAIAARDQANFTLRRELDAARRQFAEVTTSLEKNHRGLVSLLSQNRSLEGNIRQLRDEIGRIEKERNLAENDRVELLRTLNEMQSSLDGAKSRNQALASELEATGAQLSAALNDREHATERGMKLGERVEVLHGKLADLRDTQTELLGRLAETSQTESERLTKILASTGVNVERLLAAQGGASAAQGGPFEAAERSANGNKTTPDETLELALAEAGGHLDRLEGLRKTIRSVPLIAPLDAYYVSSSYGKRKDPINGQVAMHRGLDFGARYRSPVFATAPGIVKYAGWKGLYGRFVEIDHGNGISTRYGHLRRIHVKRGQEVDFRDKIAEMGNSGRSTGTHLHYEIVVDGDTVDPMKFLKAGKDVFKG